MEAFFDHAFDDLKFPDLGSASDDFRKQLKQLATLLRSQQGQILAALPVGSRLDKDLQKALEEQWVTPRKR